MQALPQGNGLFLQEPNAAQLTTDLQNMLMNNMAYALLQ